MPHMEDFPGSADNSSAAFSAAGSSLKTDDTDPDCGDDVFEDAVDPDDLVAIDDVVADDHDGQHPALRTMCVMDCRTRSRIVPNGPAAVIDNDCFSGRVMLLVRTPDADSVHGDQHSPRMHEMPLRVSQYFRGKKRRFEFQFQIRLKRVPTGPLFLGCELEQHIKVGTITKGLVNILLAMVRRINPGFHYSWGPDLGKVSAHDLETGNYEKTHLSFPVEASMDRIVISKPGDLIPDLGDELEETAESVKRRRKLGAGSVDWNCQDTYTMCLWSAYCDWIKWRSMNVPGMSPFSLSRVTGTQPIYLCVYEIGHISPTEYRKVRPPHTRQSLHVYTRLEFSNDTRTVGGLAERLLGRSCTNPIVGGAGGGGGGTDPSDPGNTNHMSSERSLPDTEPMDSDFETASRVTMG